MTRAEELAEQFLDLCECGETTWSDDYKTSLKFRFKSYLESYAEERVKDFASGRQTFTTHDFAIERELSRAARNEALEEAAKVIDTKAADSLFLDRSVIGYDYMKLLERIADCVRALKSNP